MSDRRKHDSPTNTYREICSRVLKLSRNKTNPSGKSPKQTQSTGYVGKSPHTRFKANLQTPKRQARCRYTGLNNSADSPGDGDVLQDIIWDPTSPTPRSGKAPGNGKVIEISDIVNRIAPKDAKPISVDNSLLQWIGDSAVPCTPEYSLPRARRTLKRKSSVEDLMHLARQFDINMQQGHEEHSTEHITNINNNNNINNPCGAEHKHPVTMTTGVSSAQQVEAELNALFDGPTQRISGRFSQASSASACSQEGNGAVRVPAVGGQVTGSEVKRGSETMPCSTARIDDKVVGAANSTATPPKDEDFDDDWENDDLLNDPFVLEITQNPAGLETSTCKPSSTLTADRDSTPTKSLHTTISHSACKGSGPNPPPLNTGGLAGPWPKHKLSKRSTFILESNPCFKVNMSHVNEGSPIPRPGISAGKGPPGEPSPASSKSPRQTPGPAPRQTPGPAPRQTPGPAPRQTPGPAPRQTPSGSSSGPATDAAFREISDDDLQSLFDSELLWNDDQGDDDVLLYQVCDDVERVSNSQTTSNEVSTTRAAGGSGTGSGPVTTGSYFRSNSEPGDRSSTHVNFQGWNIPAKAGNVGVGHQPLVSCSRPGRAEVLDKFTQLRDAKGWVASGQGALETRNFQTGNTKTVMPRTVSARTLANTDTSHASLFKRHLSDSAVCNKVFFTSQVTGKCTAAEIERKKQEAIARRKSKQTSLKTP
ncbi:ewing's tumor-associated antigen 1 homolog isoform X1 [Esox lucius]|uniref:ETAA1 activator of ATR kinase n=1 Tax=Esox lucius TaxID=8010 RepID=A0A3P9A4Q9_ESOLU|nr:ewing's tumor-associated antigen 1 homolog isoform X1 [Esox lucius]